MQFVGNAARYNRVPRVVAALGTHHHVGLFRQNIDNLALSFIAPLGAHQCGNRHTAYLRKQNTFLLYKIYMQ